jgi:hypothetical protein
MSPVGSERRQRGLMTRILKYIELKTRQAGKGPAWIARVALSRSGMTVYFNRKALRRARKGGISGNHFDVETGEEYWVSGVKKDGTDRHWAGSGKVAIEASAVPEYFEIVGATQLDESRLFVVADLPETAVERFHERANEPL